MEVSILVIEDDESLNRLLTKKLRQKGFRVDSTRSGEEAEKLLKENNYEIALVDIKLTDMSGLELIRELSPHTNTKFIVVTGYGDVNTAVEAMRAGASDFIQKPFSFDILEVSINRAIREKQLEEENRTLRSFLFEKEHDITFETRSPIFRQVLEIIENAARSDINILLRGETGTGKEVIARYIHRVSDRRDKPFIVVDCSAIPEHLFESELFGHEKGAYTGAVQRKVGLVEIADGGTLFLDEIGEVPLPVQAKLLRFVETRKFRRVGGLKEIGVNVRIVAATNRNLKEMVQKGEFRSDLLYRLNSMEVEIPPLRERKEDIPMLAQLFLKRFKKKIGEKGIKLLMGYDWPGNVRELKNTIERASLLSKGDYVDDSLCLPSISEEEACLEDLFSKMPTLRDLELFYVSYLYRKLGSAERVAEVLGCSRRTVFRKLKELRDRNGDLEGRPLPWSALDIN
ncbi:two-component system NtrC family response regulator [Hydrogenivirga caldilitoris]|uniref:Two-component system NtrC family response regulator n=1 Tax=Hydrogenivirga caldilitoris TaxID=246264 RepID=A0A497XSL5_9AQUI|nr:sigma-54 dependent transcriptional regulator [Hydrogenivirga caldilitoris]RLJ71150.1 two-component system NtrC family response regulator [Hydrogenivirga caldilitoris]